MPLTDLNNPNPPHRLNSPDGNCECGEWKIPEALARTLDLDQVIELYALHVSTFRNNAFVEAMIERYEANPMIGRWDLEELLGLIEATIKAGF